MIENIHWRGTTPYFGAARFLIKKTGNPMDWAGFATGSLMIFPAGAGQATMSDHQFSAIPI
ncbi:MAG TPA: hypothetical protein PLU04_14470 [Anaerolineaceae bacterium]|nr:hypothetical protein [Anaerolineaceae bacterium]